MNELSHYEHHHLSRRFAYPGLSLEDSFNALFAPEALPNFAAASFTITLFRTIGEVVPGKIFNNQLFLR